MTHLLNEPKFGDIFRELMLNDVKICTTRSKRLGNAGDTFDKWGATFVITGFEKRMLREIADEYRAREGFETKEAFLAYFKKLHPRIGGELDHNWTVTHFRKYLE